MSTGRVALHPVCEETAFFPGCFCSRQSSQKPDESILIYLSVTGSLIPLRVLESDSIAMVKLRLQTCKGFVVKRQKLVFGGRELARNDSLVKEYGVTDGNVLHLVLRLSDLQVIMVRTTCGKELKFHIERGTNVGHVKRQIAKKRGAFVDLNDQELIYNGEKLNDQRLIDDIGEDNDAVIHLLVQKSAKVRAKPVEKDFELSIVAPNLNESRVEKEHERKCRTRLDELHLVMSKPLDRGFWLEPVIVNPKVELPDVINDLINAVIAGLEKGNSPIRSSEGSGGAYFMQDELGQLIAVFKPIDEEPMAVNNPQGLPLTSDGEGLKRGTRVGEGALREVAAYILDHPRSGRRSYFGDGIGFSGVPPTVMIRCLHKGFNHPQGYEFALKNMKIGSLQMFVNNYGSCEDMGPRAFPVEEVHKISVLDIRLANADRHAGNILVRKERAEGQISLVPIDHGYCLPEKFEDCTFDWLYWPQARQPYNPEIIDYIKSLDAEQDIALLKFHGWELSLECSRTIRISTMLLKKGVERGLTPHAIGSIMCRETLRKESVIEEIVSEAQGAVLPGTSESAFLESISQIMDRRLDDISA